MKKELDKELYPDYVYPEFTPDPNEPFREPIAKLGKKITECFLMRKQNWH